MLKTRLIPVLLYKNGILVRSKSFSFHQSTGDPIGQVERFTAWKADELIYIDISRDNVYNSQNTLSMVGSGTSKNEISATTADNFIDVIHTISKKCMIPLTVGGKIRTLEDIKVRIGNGADKVCINTQAVETPEFIDVAAKKFGKQCIVISVDFKFDVKEKKYEVFTCFGKNSTGLDPVAWCKEVQSRGAGEILLQSIDRDGLAIGYDLELINKVSQSVEVPVISLGGVGKFEHLVAGVKDGQASAVAAANIFHFTEHSIINAKRVMASMGVDVRL